jgi:hypothetical protein
MDLLRQEYDDHRCLRQMQVFGVGMRWVPVDKVVTPLQLQQEGKVVC